MSVAPAMNTIPRPWPKTQMAAASGTLMSNADRLSRFWGQQILAVDQPAEAIAFVQAEQQKWKPVLELIASKAK